MSDKTKILFVCLGNICRSPLAEAIFNHKIKNSAKADAFEVNSCGTANYHVGDTPDERTIRNALDNGVTIDHCGRQLAAGDLDYFDYILAMDAENYKNIFRLPTAKANSDKIHLMRAYDPEGDGDVPDPYYGGEKNFQNVFEILDRSLDNFLKIVSVANS